MGKKVFSSAGLQFRISNYLALMAKYDFIKYGRLTDFADILYQQDHSQVQTILEEGKLLTRSMLKATIDSVDTVSHVLASGLS